MKNFYRLLAKVLFSLVGVGVFLFVATLTLNLAKRIYPDDLFTPWFSLLIFDIGALTWLFVFSHSAEGGGQRVISVLMFVIDLVGVFVVVSAEVMLGGQELAEIPPEVGQYAVYALIAWTFVNLVGFYLFHLFSPENVRNIIQRSAADKITARSLEMLEQRTDEISDEVATELAHDLVNQTLYELGAMKQVRAMSTPPAVLETEPVPVTVSQNGYHAETDMSGVNFTQPLQTD